MDGGFDRVDQDLRALRGEMTARFERMDVRIDSLQRSMLQLGGAAIVTFAVGFAGLTATHV